MTRSIERRGYVCRRVCRSNASFETRTLGHAIVTAAEETEYDLIVVGSKGHSSLDRVFLGSTSDFVATHSSKSVLVVRMPTRAIIPDEKLKITIAYDESEYSENAIQQFSEFSVGEEFRS